MSELQEGAIVAGKNPNGSLVVKRLNAAETRAIYALAETNDPVHAVAAGISAARLEEILADADFQLFFLKIQQQMLDAAGLQETKLDAVLSKALEKMSEDNYRVTKEDVPVLNLIMDRKGWKKQKLDVNLKFENPYRKMTDEEFAKEVREREEWEKSHAVQGESQAQPG
jgi:hypothetical protein